MSKESMKALTEFRTNQYYGVDVTGIYLSGDDDDKHYVSHHTDTTTIADIIDWIRNNTSIEILVGIVGTDMIMSGRSFFETDTRTVEEREDQEYF